MKRSILSTLRSETSMQHAIRRSALVEIIRRSILEYGLRASNKVFYAEEFEKLQSDGSRDFLSGSSSLDLSAVPLPHETSNMWVACAATRAQHGEQVAAENNVGQSRRVLGMIAVTVIAASIHPGFRPDSAGLELRHFYVRRDARRAEGSAA
ncbi:hypothetical protein GUITHDRAFT_103677 [Guillardia theta CCMP2712]|uniref:Uncharacterized protein n=1 Tax=Guillardia theta (strain CCMP2712) TaxID=905079 RepID=L1JQS8_GUITC|nr:hypothetical protein GUITHDRAFT_103677 [Guillardia theta CCMP2712]EKX50443.1 hypothetical protein GUITHDRAFT_103677 [Guillardia theta CCMP2712]|eukprot:XP_005837423.1 hypothetical protein GUITHDRAFT_103677 [Guillardia theta CCMP2712]